MVIGFFGSGIKPCGANCGKNKSRLRKGGKISG